VKDFLRKIVLYMFHIGFARPVLQWVVGVRYRRRSLVPDGPCLVVSNHNSHLDAAILMGLFPLRRLPTVHPVAAADYFGSTLFLQALAMWMMNGIPIQRRPKPGSDPLQPLLERLGDGHSLVFFPEGSRGEAGVVARFRPGIGRLVRKMPELRVVPVYLAGPERIWPRGQFVPVPLNVDAIVGKPRTYDPGDDSRTIAEKVQRDVLSLAPPPPPSPEDAARAPLRVAVCGLDAEARSAATRAIALRLGREGKALGLGSTLIEVEGDEVKQSPTPVKHLPNRAWNGLMAKIVGAGRQFSWREFHAKIEIDRVAETVGERRSACFVATDGSALVDFSAWAAADFYRGPLEDGEMNRVVEYLSGKVKIPFGKWWKYLRGAPEVWLVNEWSLVRPAIPDVLVLALQSSEPSEARERLQRGYRRIGELLRRRHRTIVLEYDPSEGEVDQLAETVVEKIQGSDRAREVPGLSLQQ
jgi:1-acyl-sn-glycerol-3-phosphate acyltransferase